MDDLQAGLIARAKRIEDDIRDRVLELALSQNIAILQDQPAWKTILERVRELEDGETMKLRAIEMSPYELGKRQGFLRGLKVLRLAKPLNPEELALRENEISLLREQVVEMRRLSE